VSALDTPHEDVTLCSKITAAVDTVLFDLDGTLCAYERPPDAVLALAFERALFVGDSFGSDVVGARALGMTTVWVTDDDTPPTESVVPTCVLDSTGDLHAALLNR